MEGFYSQIDVAGPTLHIMLLVELNIADTASAKLVGGKGASLSRLYKISALQNHAPKSFALSTEFFKPWLDIITSTTEYAVCQKDSDSGGSLEVACKKLKQNCHTIPLNFSQHSAINDIATKMDHFLHGLAAVRSSAVDEDGTDHSFAGIFETKLGVRASDLEGAVRACFASMFDLRVLRYSKQAAGPKEVGFAVVIMEMVDSIVAGVAFSANPLNSDRDECVVDSSWGLGESVVDGSVTADRFVFDKVNKALVNQKIGSKLIEKRLDTFNGSVKTVAVEESKVDACSLSPKQLEELIDLICVVEKEYGMPMDIEWAITDENICILLQARPITTLFWLDDDMMTQPGERRKLYYDFNIASEATTTTPFSHMDLAFYTILTNKLFRLPSDASFFSQNPNMPMFNASSRQYMNMSIFFRYLKPAYFSKEALFLDPYLSSLYASKDCSRRKYRAKKLPKGVNVKNSLWYLRQFPLLKWYKLGMTAKRKPEEFKRNYAQVLRQDLSRLKTLEERGRGRGGIVQYSYELIESLEPSLTLEMGAIMAGLLTMFQKMDRKRQFGKTEEDREEYEALCGGYEGDPLMELNIDLYKLANKLDESIWEQYNHDRLPDLIVRVQNNLDGEISDLPIDFLTEWQRFIETHGYDGEDQLFVSSPRYQDRPLLLLVRLRQNIGSHVKDPSIRLHENLLKRKEVQQRQADRVKSKCLKVGYSKILKRNKILDHLMWIRNAPKLHLSRVFGALRKAVLKIEHQLVMEKRLDVTGDIFHLDPVEIDAALNDPSFDLMAMVKQRKSVYERATNATECPMLIDSRCRILRPDPPKPADLIPGILVGAAVAPGMATGRVRVIKSPTGRFEPGEVLVTTVTSPAWTPLFVSAAGIVLQIGGALQHGALCAREYGKPAVSNIDIHNLETGMIVTVDGNKGIVTIISEQ